MLPYVFHEFKSALLVLVAPATGLQPVCQLEFILVSGSLCGNALQIDAGFLVVLALVVLEKGLQTVEVVLCGSLLYILPPACFVGRIIFLVDEEDSSCLPTSLCDAGIGWMVTRGKSYCVRMPCRSR